MRHFIAKKFADLGCEWEWLAKFAPLELPAKKFDLRGLIAGATLACTTSASQFGKI